MCCLNCLLCSFRARSGAGAFPRTFRCCRCCLTSSASRYFVPCSLRTRCNAGALSRGLEGRPQAPDSSARPRPATSLQGRPVVLQLRAQGGQSPRPPKGTAPGALQDARRPRPPASHGPAPHRLVCVVQPLRAPSPAKGPAAAGSRGAVDGLAERVAAFPSERGHAGLPHRRTPPSSQDLAQEALPFDLEALRWPQGLALELT
eukprot:8499106-Lingulodinium_polyedra.AAC.1